jgi:hypothetical protein
MFHDHEMDGHPRELETFNSIRNHYWWPGLRTFVKNYVKGCGTCQQFKIDRHPSKPTYIPTEGSKTTRPIAKCSMDFITDLPEIDSFDSIFVVVDQGLVRGRYSFPAIKLSTRKELGNFYSTNLYKRFGLPDKIISDRNPQFASKAFLELLKLLGITSALSTAYHPQTDGTTNELTRKMKCTYPSTAAPTEVFTLPHRFLPESGGIRSFLRNPAELNFGRGPCQNCHSGHH